jgi:Kdo2-lipid IVA lauroyltransferase/acyltransferase
MDGAPRNYLTFSRKLRYGAEAALFFLLMGLFRLFSLDAASCLGGWIGRNIFARLPPGRIARKNLKAAFPEKSETEIQAILTGMWDNLGRTVAEYPHLKKFDRVGPGTRIELDGAEYVDATRDAGQGALFLSGHLANWEIMPMLGAMLGLDGATVVRPPNNPYVARWIARQRGQRGPREQIGKHSGARRIFSQLRDDKAIYMLVDQRNDEGIAVDFFGRPAMTTPVPAALATKTGARILIVGNRRKGRSAQFEVTVRPGPEVTASGDVEADTRLLTERITAQVEAIIRSDPSQWLWIHRRWGR